MSNRAVGQAPSADTRAPRDAPRRVARIWPYRAALVFGALAVCEVALRWLNPDILRFDADVRGAVFQYDAELGWMGQPNTTKPFVRNSQHTATHNSMGLRDAEIGGDARPRILVLGDSFVWGFGVDADDRFTNRLQAEVDNYRIVNAGMSGFGTDQEYLLMKRLWDRILPAFVLLVVCTHNDHKDNTNSVVYGGYYKPYFRSPPGVFDGQPVPVSPSYVFQRWLVARWSYVARLLARTAIEMRHPAEQVPDPTETLVLMIREFTEAHGARFAMALTGRDEALEPFLAAKGIPFVSLDGAERFPGGVDEHWTPAGNVEVAKRVATLLGELDVPAR